MNPDAAFATHPWLPVVAILSFIAFVVVARVMWQLAAMWLSSWRERPMPYDELKTLQQRRRQQAEATLLRARR